MLLTLVTVIVCIIGITGGGASIKNLNLVNAKAVWNATSSVENNEPSLGILCGEIRFDDSVIENVHSSKISMRRT